MNSDIPQPPPAVMPAAADLEADRIAEAAQAAAAELEPDYAAWEYQAASQEAPAAVQAPRTGPVLLHSGHYALYQTPAGLYHLTYQREASTHPDTGEVLAVLDAPEVHFRDLPEQAAQMILAVLDREQELPPMLQAFLFGGNPLNGGRAAMMKQIAGLVSEAGGVDQLLNFAAGNGGQGDGPVE